MRELDRQQYRLLQRFLGALQPRHIIPAHIRRLLENRACQCAPQLLAILVQRLRPRVPILPSLLPLPSPRGRRAISTHHPGLLALGFGVGEVGFELFRAVHVLARFGADHLFGLRVLLPFEGEHEELEGLVVELVGFFVLGGVVGIDGEADLLDRAVEKVGVGHGGR
ncbi:hypothetical protein VTI74DRAFT_8363 [Chaetomium olivicolor]